MLMTQSCLFLNKALWEAECLVWNGESLIAKDIEHTVYFITQSNIPQLVSAARQSVQFGLSCGQQIVSCSVTRLSSHDSIRCWHCQVWLFYNVQSHVAMCWVWLFQLLVVKPSWSPWFPQLLDSRAGPKTPIVAPFLGVPDPGSMWGWGPAQARHAVVAFLCGHAAIPLRRGIAMD
jgi:hypothetical protein